MYVIPSPQADAALAYLAADHEALPDRTPLQRRAVF
jgi:hypothetical protein